MLSCSSASLSRLRVYSPCLALRGASGSGKHSGSVLDHDGTHTLVASCLWKSLTKGVDTRTCVTKAPICQNSRSNAAKTHPQLGPCRCLTTSAFTAASVPEHGGGASSSTLQQTVEHARKKEVVADAIIKTIDVVSPTVRKLTLELEESGAQKFQFFPGMWVDFYIPEIDKVGGYTIISLPEELPYLQLAIKVTSHPPAAWIGNKAKLGDKIILRAGGTFHLADILPNADGKMLVDLSSGLPHTAPPTKVDHLLMVAGGIGLTPLYAMVRHWVSARCHDTHGKLAIPSRMTLLYSAKNMDELVFLHELKALEKEMTPAGSFTLHLHVTQGEPSNGANKGRIQLGDLVAALSGDGSSGAPDIENVLCCVCGPQKMADGMSMLLRALGLKPGQVRLEKWW